MAFKKGDKVKVYGYFVPDVNGRYYYLRGSVAKVLYPLTDDEIFIKILTEGTASSGLEGSVHPKQCEKAKRNEK